MSQRHIISSYLEFEQNAKKMGLGEQARNGTKIEGMKIFPGGEIEKNIRGAQANFYTKKNRQKS